MLSGSAEGEVRSSTPATIERYGASGLPGITVSGLLTRLTKLSSWINLFLLGMMVTGTGRILSRRLIVEQKARRPIRRVGVCAAVAVAVGVLSARESAHAVTIGNIASFSTAGTYPRRSISVAEPRPDGGDDFQIWETDRLLERGGRRGFDNPLRGRPSS